MSLLILVARETQLCTWRESTNEETEYIKQETNTNLSRKREKNTIQFPHRNPASTEVRLQETNFITHNPTRKKKKKNLTNRKRRWETSQSESGGRFQTCDRKQRRSGRTESPRGLLPEHREPSAWRIQLWWTDVSTGTYRHRPARVLNRLVLKGSVLRGSA